MHKLKNTRNLTSWHSWNATIGHQNSIPPPETHGLFWYLVWAQSLDLSKIGCKGSLVKYFGVRLRLMHEKGAGVGVGATMKKENNNPISHLQIVEAINGTYKCKIFIPMFNCNAFYIYFFYIVIISSTFLCKGLFHKGR